MINLSRTDLPINCFSELAEKYRIYIYILDWNMSPKIKILILGFFSIVLSSCTSKSSSSSGGGSSESSSSGSTASGTKTGTDGGLSSLESLLKSLGGKTTGTSGTQTGTGTAAADPATMQWAPNSPDMFVSFQLYEAKKNYLNQSSIAAGKDPTSNYDTYECPGDSFLTGLRGAWDPDNKDRIMQAGCRFFADGLGKPVKKQNCSIINGINAGQANDDISCPAAKFFAGFTAIYDQSKSDRSYNFECCEAVTEDGKKLDFLTQSGAQICEQSGQASDFMDKRTLKLNLACTGAVGNTVAATLIHSISNTYFSSNGNDRTFNIECCVIGPSSSSSQ